MTRLLLQNEHFWLVKGRSRRNLRLLEPRGFDSLVTSTSSAKPTARRPSVAISVSSGEAPARGERAANSGKARAPTPH